MRKGIVVFFWLLFLAWMGGIFYLSTLEEEAVPGVGTLMPDYINHGGSYFLLAFLLFIALQRTWRSNLTVALAVIVGWCLLFGLGVEFAQKYLTATRHFSLWDWLADGVGAGLLFLLLLALQKGGERSKQLYSLLAGELENRS